MTDLQNDILNSLRVCRALDLKPKFNHKYNRCLQLRVYTAENVVNELERAKVEYLEVSIGITSKKKIVVPKLLHWHMRDFADDIGSLVEWTYSQLPRTGTLKRGIMECLSGDTKAPLAKMVEIQPYEAEFRYLLPF